VGYVDAHAEHVPDLEDLPIDEEAGPSTSEG